MEITSRKIHKQNDTRKIVSVLTKVCVKLDTFEGTEYNLTGPSKQIADLLNGYTDTTPVIDKYPRNVFLTLRITRHTDYGSRTDPMYMVIIGTLERYTYYPSSVALIRRQDSFAETKLTLESAEEISFESNTSTQISEFITNLIFKILYK